MLLPKPRKLAKFISFVCLGLLLAVLLIPSSCVSSKDREITVYIQQLRDKDSQVRWWAATNLGQSDVNAESSIPQLVEATEDEDSWVRSSAVATLGKIRSQPEITIPCLVRRLKDWNQEVQQAAAVALGRMGSPAVPELIKLFKDRDSNVRRHAAFALSAIGSEAKAAVPALIKATQDSNRAVRQQAIEALGQVGSDEKTATPVLIAALKNQDWQIRATAAHTLGKIGSPAKSVIPALISALNDPDAVVRLRATLALGQLSSDAVPLLAKTLRERQQPARVRSHASYALGEMGIEAQEAIPALIELLGENNAEIRQGVLFALKQIGYPAIPELTKALRHQNRQVRNTAAVALGKISESLQDNSNRLYSEELDQAISNLEQAQLVLNPRQPNLAGEISAISASGERFPQDAVDSVRRGVDALKTERDSDFQFLALFILISVLALLALIGFFVFWVRPVILLRLSSAAIAAQQEQEMLSQMLTTIEQFLEQAGVQVKRENKQVLRVVAASGRLKSLSPLPVLLAMGQPTAQDVTELMQCAERLGSERQQRSGILLYRQSPDTLFRVRMAEVRLRDRFVLIPIPLAAVEQSVSDPAACVGLLAQYSDRYLPGADLFDDRNAIGDTLSFFGRAELLHRLEQELVRQQGIGLFGLRKSGKTSILLQLGFALRRHPVVHLDLQPYGGKLRYGAELFNEILRQLLGRLHEHNTTAIATFEPFSADIPAAALTTEFVQYISKIAVQLTAAKYEPPILLFLDEIERILPVATDPLEKVEEFNAFFGGLRVLSQEQRLLGLLVADVHPDCNRINQWQQEGVPTNPVFSFFKEVFLSSFSEEETKTMLVDISRLMGRSFDRETLTAIYQESGGHPFIARQLASLLCAKVPEQEDGQISCSTAQRYLNRPFSYSSVLKDYFGQNIWADLKKRQFEAAIAILKLLAYNFDVPGGMAEKDLLAFLSSLFTESQCLDALLWLEMVGLVKRVEAQDDNDYYRSHVPLLSRWLQMEMGEQESRQWQIQ
ncbi:hypothetical protein NIES2119_31320 [[Phormidium ambiguum] IAM M-71]|uniref:AAA+ ATPase domain-containing protein n=1 Tax=[Phormidium ambiguum] IAM M-71 TaxID=454136 RepID=A0A1U7I2I8_9CYAN|nr:HEAT repeat domain-containing protein [Phormidium ambiguum]OKH30225.1 hypothetical protein NIES2119_31320 [Phormidium ambiguum IAM M-71]